MIKTLFFAAAALIAASQARADWQYVRWGATPEQAIAASKGELKAAQADGRNVACAFKDQTVVARIPRKKVGPIDTEVIVCAGSNGKVSSVVLRPIPPDDAYNSLRAALQAQYGQPIEDGRGEISITAWRDAKTKNLVRLVRVIGTGAIEYRGVTSGL